MRNTIIIILCFFTAICVAQRGITYPSSYSTTGIMKANPNGVFDAENVALILDTLSNKLYVNQGNGAWTTLDQIASVDTYTVADGNTTVFVEASSTGVSVTEDAASGLITIAVPTDVDIYKLVITTTSNTLDNGNDLYVRLDYATARTYNTAKTSLNIPSITIGNAGTTLSRTSPMILTEKGNANVDVGVSSFGGGDGSDLEIAFKDMLVAPTMIINLNF